MDSRRGCDDMKLRAVESVLVVGCAVNVARQQRHTLGYIFFAVVSVVGGSRTIHLPQTLIFFLGDELTATRLSELFLHLRLRNRSS